MRLNKFLSQANVGSRRKCDELVGRGFVEINGKVVRDPWVRVHPGEDTVSFLGQNLTRTHSFTYILLNKPSGYIVSSFDPRGRKTVMDLIGSVKERVFPVGRLDYMTEGLLILTNDGEMSLRLTHPRFGIEKCYHVTVSGRVTREKLGSLITPVEFPDGKRSNVVRAKLVSETKDESKIELVLKEGWKHEVRRICEANGLKVLSLRRVSFGPLTLGNLMTGAFRFLTSREVHSLEKAAGITRKN
ncbi:MAG: pseudouridine synthase [Candidatus Eisenbacteria bacterium]|nr:pseudouridine synthase [Candidatus Eisenbacteria bacterium]